MAPGDPIANFLNINQYIFNYKNCQKRLQVNQLMIKVPNKAPGDAITNFLDSTRFGLSFWCFFFSCSDFVYLLFCISANGVYTFHISTFHLSPFLITAFHVSIFCFHFLCFCFFVFLLFVFLLLTILEGL